MSITTTSDVSPLTLQSLVPGALAVPTANFNYALGADKHYMPAHGGTTLRFFRPDPLLPPIVPIGNSGIEPTSQVLSRKVIDATVSFYTTSVILNEQTLLQNQDNILAWGAERLGVAQKQAEDIILRQFLLSACSQYNCQGGTNGDNPTDPGTSDFAALNAQLDTANAYKYVVGQRGEDRFGSVPQRSRFIMFCHSLLEQTLDANPDFTNVMSYPSDMRTIYPEYGSILNFSLLVSSQASISPSASMLGNTVFNNFAVARQSYAHIQQDQYNVKLLYRDPIFSGPSALNGTLAIKFAQAQCLKQDTWLSNFRCTAAA